MKQQPTLWLAVLMTALLCLSTPSFSQQQGSDDGNSATAQFTLNLKKADITTLIATVSEITGRNFVVDPRVKGKVTVLSAHPMSAADLYQTFLSVLAVHGFAAVPAGSVTKIVPQVNAKQDGSYGRNTHTSEDIVTRVIKINNVPAAQLVPILRPLVPQYGHLAAYPASNILIISDRAANVNRIARIVSKIDKGGNTKVERIPLKHASAAEVARLITQLKTGGAKGARTAAAYTVIADERTNSILISGDPAARLRLRAIIANLDTPSNQQGGTQVIYLDYADAESIDKALQSFVEGKADKKAGKNEISIVADKGANALIITAPPEQMHQIRQVVDKLDIRRGQVLVQAIIAEISVNRTRQLGVDIAAFDPSGGAVASILTPGAVGQIAAAVGGNPLGLVGQGVTAAIGSISSTGTSFAALIKAMSKDQGTNVLSTPSIITRDNEKAKITVAQEVPFVTGSYTGTGLTSGGGGTGIVNPFQTVQRKDVGLLLSITPQINAGDTIKLDISLEVSSIAGNSANAVDLITNKRTIDTSVVVNDGQVLVLGGLIDNQVMESNSQVPLLGDIPLLGALFQYHSVKKVKRNLLNFIRPTILRGHGAANYYTRQKYNHIRELQQRERGRPIPLLPGAKRPLAPTLDSYDQHPDFSKDAGRRDQDSTGTGNAVDQIPDSTGQ